MDKRRSDKPRLSVVTPWLWLGFAAVFWLFAGGRYVVVGAAWLAPVFMLRWLRGRRVAVGFPLAVLAAAAANFFAWRGITDVIMSAYQYVAFAVAAAVVYLTPYFADRALSPRLRAVENGFSLFRPDNDGVSVATDYLGRTIANMDYFAAEDPVVVAHLPTRGVWTAYPRTGDVFAWLVVAAFAVFYRPRVAAKTENVQKIRISIVVPNDYHQFLLRSAQQIQITYFPGLTWPRRSFPEIYENPNNGSRR